MKKVFFQLLWIWNGFPGFLMIGQVWSCLLRKRAFCDPGYAQDFAFFPFLNWASRRSVHGGTGRVLGSFLSAVGESAENTTHSFRGRMQGTYKKERWPFSTLRGLATWWGFTCLIFASILSVPVVSQNSHRNTENDFLPLLFYSINPVNKRGFQIQYRNLITVIQLYVCTASSKINHFPPRVVTPWVSLARKPI